jgi:hypothetical protein
LLRLDLLLLLRKTRTGRCLVRVAV